MNTLSSVAQNIKDFYLQDYAQGEEFFNEYHYSYLAAAIYHNILDELYKSSYALNKAESGVGFPNINPEWFIPEEVKVKRVAKSCIATLSKNVFSFVYDRQACALGEVVPICSKCEEFIKIPADQGYSIKLLPNIAKTWYWLKSKNQVEFSKITMEDETVLINYLPVIDPKSEEEQFLPEAMEKMIIEQSLAWLKGFNQGTVVDMTNNGNPNKVFETEIDNSFRKKSA